MPTNRRRRVSAMREDFDELNASQEFELQYGESLITGEEFEDEDAMCTAWELHRDRLLADWIKEKPGTRPFAEWLFRLVPLYGERRIIDADYVARFGRVGVKHGIMHTCDLAWIQEPERDFLARHGELTLEEQQRLSAETPA